MTGFVVNPEDFADMPEIIKRMRYCLRNKIGFSLVRIGDAENQVMAQGTEYTDLELHKIWWSDDEAWAGVTLPNYQARNQLLDSVRNADMVGVLHMNEAYIWKPLTEKLFTYYKIKPPQICYAFINIYFSAYQDFIDLMKKYRVLLVGRPAWFFARLLQDRYNIHAAGVVPVNRFQDIPLAIKTIQNITYDLALISAGVNAVVIAAALAQEGKVALDFGRGMNPEYWVSPGSHGKDMF